MMRQMKALEDDNQRLMRMFTDLDLQLHLLLEALGRK